MTYNDFMDLLCPPEEEDWQLLEPAAEGSAGGGEAGEAAGGGKPPAVKRQLSRVKPKGGAELMQLAQAQDREEEVRR